jgi:hypothetical protein
MKTWAVHVERMSRGIEKARGGRLEMRWKGEGMIMICQE